MVSPVSVGDALMLSGLAYRIGLAFTSGRKSAPAEFEEIKDQLFALSNALKILDNEKLENSRGATVSTTDVSEEEKKRSDNEDILESMILNCRETLKHLESLVDKYTVIDPNAKNSSQTVVRKWQQDVKKNWKKIQWTTEGGNLNKLQNNLTVHINGLNLAVSALHSTQTRNIEPKINGMDEKLSEIFDWYNKNLKLSDMQTRKIETQLKGVDEKLTEIFAWYTENLKHPKAESASNIPNSFSQPVSEADSKLLFGVFAEVPGNTVMGLICPKASFRRDWLKFRNRGGALGLFQCHCLSGLNEGFQFPNDRSLEEDHSGHLQFFLLPVTLITRLVGFPNLWQLYTSWGASNGSVSLILGGMAPSNLAEFRHCVGQLAIEQAKGLIGNRLDSMLMHYMSDGVQESIRILNSKCDCTQFTGTISRITFVVQNRRFVEESIGSVELLHYQSLLLPNTTLLNQRHAELIIRRTSSQLGTISHQNPHQYIVNIEYDTEITKQSNSRLVHISRSECSEETGASEPKHISGADLEIEFISNSIAENFIASLKAMQKELFVLYLCFPRTGENIVFQRPVGDIMIRDFYLPDATLSIVSDPTVNEYRIILLSYCTSVCVSMKVPSSFDTSTQNSTAHLINEYPAYYVRIGRDKTTVTEQSTGFRFFLPTDEDAQQQFLRMISQMSIKEGPDTGLT